MAQPRNPFLPQCYFTLDDDTPPDAVRTCGDPIRAHVHLNPVSGETLSINNLKVNFKCKVRTLIRTGSGKNRRLHKSKVYLFFFSTQVQGHRSISINSQQSWPVAFEFPWAVLPHPTQREFNASAIFPHQPGHPLPPTWQRECRGYIQSVRYYLEAVMTREGRMVDHTDKKTLEFNFSPPLDDLNPVHMIQQGMRQSITRSSRLLDPEKRDEHYGFRERTRHLFSNESDPTAAFGLSATAPTICCLGDSLPITLKFQYDDKSSTAPKQPNVTLRSIYIRLTDFVQYRVPFKSLFSDSDLDRDSEEKVDLARRSLFNNSPIVHDGMSLNDFVNVTVSSAKIGCSFTTFSINRSYMLKISGVFECAGKEYDLVLYRRSLRVHPPRELFREIPTTLQSPERSATRPNATQREEVLPPYVAGSSDAKPPPSYEEGTS